MGEVDLSSIGSVLMSRFISTVARSAGETSTDVVLEVLTDARHMSTMMPCRFAIYEGKDGKVHIAKLNTGLLGKVFGGTVAEIMGGKVAVDEEKILRSILGK